MSQLVVELAHLDAVAQHSADAATRSGQLKVEDGLEKVKTAMRGGDSGDAATDAGRHVDDMSKRMARGLEVFTQAVRDARNDYGEVDHSTRIDFSQLRGALEGKDNG